MGAFSFEKLELEGAYLINNFYVGDNRGGFTKCFEKDIYKKAGLDFHLSETFLSISEKNVIRGLHFQLHNPQSKLVSVVNGSAWDVIVDLRPNSRTYKKWFATELSAQKHNALYIPKGFAHGFVVLSDTAEFAYKCSDFYHPNDEGGLKWNDPDIGIVWPIPEDMELLLSDKDQKWGGIKEYTAK